MKRILLLLLAFFCVYFSFSQNEKWEYYYRNYLAQKAAFEEDENFVWIGTYGGGLISIDKDTGEKTRYDIPSLLGYGTDNHVRSLAIDSRGNKWIGAGLNLIKFDGVSCTVYDREDFGISLLLYDDYISSIAVDKDDIIWLGIGNYKVKFDGENFSVNSLCHNQDEVKKIVIDENNMKWVTTSYNFLKFNDTICEEYLTDRRTHFHYALTRDNENNIWAVYHRNSCSNSEIAKFDGQGWASFSSDNTCLPADLYIDDIAVEENGTVWLCSNYGLIKFDNNTCIVYNSTNSIIPEGISYFGNVFIDSGGKKWFYFCTLTEEGSGENGVIEIDGEEWKFHNIRNSELSSNNIQSVAFDSNNNKWIITTTGNNILKYDGVDWEEYILRDYIDLYTYVYSIIIDNNDRKILGTNKGIIIYDGDSWEIINNENSSLSLSEYHCSLYSSTSGEIWVGTSGSGIALVDDSRNLTFYNSSNSGLPDDHITSIIKDNDGNMWIGTRGSLAEFDGNNWTVYSNENSFLSSNYIMSLAVDSHNNKWIGTLNGFSKFDGINWETYTKEYFGLENLRVNSIVVDSEDNIWIGTNISGMIKLSGNEWEIFNSDNSPIYGNVINSIVIDKYDNKWICKDSYGITVYNENGINCSSEPSKTDPLSGSLISLYPNPAGSFIEIRLPESEKISLVEMADIHGQIVMRKININTSVYITDISNFSSGIYFAKVYFGNRVEVCKIIKQ